MKHFSSLLLLIMATLLLPVSCIDNEPEPYETTVLPGTPFKKTVLVYMAAQNSLGEKGFAREDSMEMTNGMKYLHDKERVLMFLDDNKAPRLYELRKGLHSPRLLRKWETDINSADTEQLTSMLRFMQEFSPSESYGLVLWSHASGWVPSPKSVAREERYNAANTGSFFALSGNAQSAPLQQVTSRSTRNQLWDTNTTTYTSVQPATAGRKLATFRPKSYGMDVGPDGNWRSDKAVLGGWADEINIEDLSEAITASGIHLRFIHFDCCLMGGIESYYELRNNTDYIAASPMEISAIGGFYTDMLRWGYFSDEIKDLGITYSNYYINKGSEPYTENFGLVLSIVRTDRLQAIADTMKSVVKEYYPARKADGSWNYPAVQEAQDYSRYTSRFHYRPHFYDMNDALRRTLSEKDWNRVKKTIDAAIVYKFSTGRFFTGLDAYDQIYMDLKNYCGISMFVPQQIYTNNAKKSAHGNVNEQFRKTKWYSAAGWKEAGW
jgi:putative peptidase